MKRFDEKEAILKLINSNRKGVTIENIIEYIDYINKTRYLENEILEILEELQEQKKIIKEGLLWYTGP